MIDVSSAEIAGSFDLGISDTKIFLDTLCIDWASDLTHLETNTLACVTILSSQIRYFAIRKAGQARAGSRHS